MRQIYAINRANERKVLESNPSVPHESGIYILTREEPLKVYVGQSVDLLGRLGSHLAGFQQHIDLSLRTHKLHSANNPFGWKVFYITCPEDDLDEMEREYIRRAQEHGHLLYNVTSGGQGVGKEDIGERRATKGYRKGVEFGYKKASKEMAKLFEKHLDYRQKSEKPNKNQEKAIARLEKFLDLGRESEGEDV